MDNSNSDLVTERIKGKKVAFLSLGCKVNAYETEVMQQLFEDAKAVTVPFTEYADIYVVNTCTVTNIADRKSRQMLHKAKKMNPDGVVVAVGCYVQAAEEEVKKDYAVNVLVGNNQKKDVVKIVSEYLQGRENRALVNVRREKKYEPLMLKTVTEKTRAHIKVQDGCNQFCSYCIIPFVRGRIRSRKEEDILAEVRNLVAQGYKEIVVSGIHLSSYGLENYSEKEQFALSIPDRQVPLLDLIVKLNEIEGLERIRLGSLEPRIITEEFVRVLSETKVCPHFHLSLQSGCDATLARMNRRYTAEEYFEKCCILRKYYENPAITTDIIVGFPGETKEEFDESVAFVKKVQFAQVHVFKYSRRHGTKADQLPDQVRDEIKNVRSDILIEVTGALRKQYEAGFIGSRVSVLWEEQVTEQGECYMTGHNERYVKFSLKTTQNLTNQMTSVTVVPGYCREAMLVREIEKE